MNVFFEADGAKLIFSDAQAALAELADCSVDAVVTDPPYGLEFMGKNWDAPWKSDRRQTFDGTLADDRDTPFSRSKVRNGNGASYGAASEVMRALQDWHYAWASECLRVLKPGGYLLAFGGARTYHRLACAVEDAGFEIRDQIMWVYGSGFPKSMDVAKMMDKAVRGVPQGGSDPTSLNHGKYKGGCSEDNPSGRGFGAGPGQFMKDSRSKYDGANRKPAPSTSNGFGYATKGGIIESDPLSEAAQIWSGWGTALKPAHEPIVVARKPLEGTVAANVQKWGTGAINIDKCRIEYEDTPNAATNPLYRTQNGYAVKVGSDSGTSSFSIKPEGGEVTANANGRWPANLIHDGSEEVASCFPDAPGQIAEISSDAPSERTKNCFGKMNREGDASAQKRYTEEGSTNFAALPGQRRFDSGSAARFFYCAKADSMDREEGMDGAIKNDHPTVKPVALMRYLCRLVTPPNGLILDPFAGSGTTLVAARREGFRVIGIERDKHYCEIGKARMSQGMLLFGAEEEF